MSDTSKFRSVAIADRLIGLSISYEPENLLARGLGWEHLRELLVRLARPLLRHSGSLAYGGHWKDTPDSFTFELLRLVSAERLDTSVPDSSGPPKAVGQLFSYSAWPAYLSIPRSVEGQWMNCCRVLRISQSRAGLKRGDQLSAEDLAKMPANPDKLTKEEVDKLPPEDRERIERLAFNSAVTLSAMRRMAMEEWFLTVGDLTRERVPPIATRIALGGRLRGYAGFAPGIFEEAYRTMKEGKPLYLLGGFGGAAEVLAKAITADTTPAEATLDWHLKNNPKLCDLQASGEKFGMPEDSLSTKQIFEGLAEQIELARANPASVLKTGLDDARTRELLQTRSIDSVVSLVFVGFKNNNKLPDIVV